MDDLVKEINKTLSEYANGVGEEVEKVAETVAKEGVKKLRLRSPKDTGEYAKSWRATKVKKAWVVNNKIYQLTHLLEKGYAKVNGGRVPGQPHIAPVEKEMINEFVKGVEEAIKG
ncbi:HK97 gp10 family phage protein [Ureibacillus sp. Re31]|uniref:HK97 gp10 family phage protein n=1 Tax=Ureibacillus galli TaxID=2762222 RepID=A0ABR8XFZ8_9BACL|nr:HK97 gp10 family phage protein [Ureibacillus galli]